MGNTRDLQENWRCRGNISCKDGHSKEKHMDLTEAEDIKKRWQEYTELYKKDLHDPDNHDDVITHLESVILEGGEDGTNGESNMETYTLPYVK